MKIKIFAAREIPYFELRIFSFNSYLYDLPRGIIASTRAFNLLTRGFELVSRVLLFHYYFRLKKLLLLD